MKQKLTILQYQELLSEDLKSSIKSLSNYHTDIEIHNIEIKGAQNSVPELLLHVYVSLGPDFWSAYFSGTLASGTIELIKQTLKLIGNDIRKKVFTYYQSDGKKQAEVTYGLKVVPREGIILEYHLQGSEELIENSLDKLYKHVERINSKGMDRLLDTYEFDKNDKSFKKKKLKKKITITSR